MTNYTFFEPYIHQIILHYILCISLSMWGYHMAFSLQNHLGWSSSQTIKTLYISFSMVFPSCRHHFSSLNDAYISILLWYEIHKLLNYLFNLCWPYPIECVIYICKLITMGPIQIHYQSHYILLVTPLTTTKKIP